MMLAIERLKRIQTNSRRLSSMDHHHKSSASGSDSPALEPPSSYPTPQWLIGNFFACVCVHGVCVSGVCLFECVYVCVQPPSSPLRSGS